MKRILGWMKKTWVLSLAGVLAVALILWYDGPLVSFAGHAPLESPDRRGALVGILFAAWGLYQVGRRIAGRFADLRISRGIGAPGAGAAPRPGEAQQHDDEGQGQAARHAAAGRAAQDAAAEVDALTRRFREALATLRTARGARRFGGQYLYLMPWYLIVGAPGAGKTTALLNSGLGFPLGETFGRAAVHGVGGTRHCDWWFTDEAVLLDTAGRFTMQESDADVDRAAWHGFLALLRKHRRRRPINGAIVAVSAMDLLRQTTAGARTHAAKIRARIQELHQQLGIRFPVYVLVTKCDLLAGFAEFFDDLDAEQRAQVWGATFAMPDSGGDDRSLAGFAADAGALVDRLQQRSMARLLQERDLGRRARIHGFPQQVANLTALLAPFLADAFGSSRYEERALLRGVYFTSGTQDGHPVDRVVARLAASFGIDGAAPGERDSVRPHRDVPTAAGQFAGRSYFLTRLLRDVIFRESGLAGSNLRLERHRLRIQRAAWLAAAASVASLATGLLVSYERNTAYVGEVESQAVAIEAAARHLPATSDIRDDLPLLDAARDLPGGYADRDRGVPLLSGLGLYQGDKLGSEAQRLYARVLRQALLPQLVVRLHDQLARGDANRPDALYALLRVYLMLADRSHFDADEVRAWAVAEAERVAGKDATEDQRRSLAGHVEALAQHLLQGEPVALDGDVVAAARHALARVPLSARLYATLQRRVQLARIPGFSVAAAGGRDASIVFARRSGEPLTGGIEGLYSPEGYRALLAAIDPAIAQVGRDGWVVGDADPVATPGEMESLRGEILELYFQDYIAQWDRFLADIGVVPLANLDQGARIVNLLAQPDSPLKKFLVAASKATTLPVVVATGGLADVVKGKLGDVRKRFEGAIAAADAATAAGEADAGTAPRDPVALHFDALHRLVAAGAGGAMPLDQQLASLNEAFVFLEAANSARRQGAPAPSGDALARLQRDAVGKPAPLGPLLASVADSGSALTLGSERARLDALWAANVSPFCRQAIDGRYPFVRGATQETTQDDFARVFAPGGLVDDFFQKNLMPFVDMSGARWRWRPFGNVALGIPADVLVQFQHAAAIRDAFFGDGGKSASIRFEVRPLQLDAGSTQFKLDVDGQSLSFGHEPARPVAFQWPAGRVTGQSRFEFSAGNADGRDAAGAEGPWAWFRILDKAQLEPTAQRDRFTVRFDLDGHRASVELRASSVVNPFRLDALAAFRCPAHL